MRGFTLIEISIVLVIIGLIVGSVLVGRDLISAAAVRAQISQIEQYQQAVNTFRGKFGVLPGDIQDLDASRFGLQNTSGNGNSILDQGTYWGNNNFTGEQNLFWVHLGQVGLVGSNVTIASINTDTGSDGTKVSDYLPVAKLDSSKYNYVWGGGLSGAPDGKNYFSLSSVHRACGYNTCGAWTADKGGSAARIKVSDAFAIDTKADDGLPQSGGIQAFYLSDAGVAIGGTWVMSAYDYYAGNGYVYVPPDSSALSSNYAAIAASATSCYDNNGTTGSIRQYSVSQNNGAGANCALSFKFQ